METEKFVEMLDKLNKLKDDGVIDENEYEKQLNKLKKQYSNATRTNANINAPSQNNSILSLFTIVILIIGGICLFSSDMFKNFTTASKEFISSFRDDTTLESSYNTTVINTYSDNNDNMNNSNISSNNNSSTVQVDVRKTYPINKKGQVTTGFGLKCAITVINYQTESNNSKLGKTESDQEFVIVNMKIENLGDDPLIISKNDFRLEDASGSRYYAATRTLESELRQAEIGVGQSQNISVRFVFLKDFSKSIVIFPDVYYETTTKLN